MKTRGKCVSILCAAAACALVMAAISIAVRPVRAAGDSIIVIVNGSNPTNNLSMGELKRLFLSDRSRWDSGRIVLPVMVAPGAPERTVFLKTVCGMSDADFSKYLLHAAFTGKSATPPKEVSSARDVKTVVANAPGAIGFVKAGDFSPDPGIKVVKVDGMAPQDAGYKLKM